MSPRLINYLRNSVNYHYDSLQGKGMFSLSFARVVSTCTVGLMTLWQIGLCQDCTNIGQQHVLGTTGLFQNGNGSHTTLGSKAHGLYSNFHLNSYQKGPKGSRTWGDWGSSVMRSLHSLSTEIDLAFWFLANHRSTVTCEAGTLEETCGHSYWFSTNCVTAHYHNANWVLTANILPIRLAPRKFSFDHSICQPSLEKKNDCSCSGDFGRFSWTHMLTHQSLIVNINRFCVIKVACIEFLHNTWTSHFNLFDLLFDNVSLDCRLFQSTSHCTFIVAKI